MSRRHNFQTISWFNDVYTRDLLDLDPPYQRRSVWNQSFKDYFVDTVLLNYPAPALFLYEEIKVDGRSLYHVVDGKQRLTTLFEFIRGEYPVAEDSALTKWRGASFSALDDATKRSFWGYQFLVEYIPVDDERIINAIFDRINRNVAKLTAQELRHARLDGVFIKAAEELAEWIEDVLPKNVPRFAQQSKKQMKDVEFIALLLLLLEDGPQGYSQTDLDKAFSDRDSTWEKRLEVESDFRNGITAVAEVLLDQTEPIDLTVTRLRNQADFYSLFGAVCALQRSGKLPSFFEIRTRLAEFSRRIEQLSERENDAELAAYYEAARSASNDKGPRETRINYLKKLLATE